VYPHYRKNIHASALVGKAITLSIIFHFYLIYFEKLLKSIILGNHITNYRGAELKVFVKLFNQNAA
jgi:hypothetical protein